MLHFQIKRTTFHIILAFLIIALLGFHVQVHAANTERNDLAHTLWDQGKSAFNERDYQTALARFSDSLSIYRKTGDRQSEADLLTWMATANIEANDFEKASNCLEESKAIYNKLNSQPGENAYFKDIDKIIKLLVLHTEVRQLYDVKAYEPAMKKTRKAIQLAREMGIKRYEKELLMLIMVIEAQPYLDIKDYESGTDYLKAFGLILIDQGVEYARQGNHSEALIKFKHALSIFEVLGREIMAALTIEHIGASFSSLKDYQEALKYQQRALEIYGKEREGHRTKKARVLCEIGEICHEMEDYQKALQYYHQASMIFLENGDQGGFTKTTTGLGLAYSKLDHIPPEYYKQVSNLIQEVGSHSGGAFFLEIVGSHFYTVGKLAEALTAFSKAIYISKELGARSSHGFALLGIGKTYVGMANYPKAIVSLRGALEIYEELENKVLQQETLKYLSRAYTLLGDHVNAKDCNAKSLNIEQHDYQTKVGQLTSLINQGITFLQEKEFDKALNIYHQALSLNKEINDKIGEEKSLYYMGIAYLGLKKYPKALESFNLSLIVSRELKRIISEQATLHSIAMTYWSQQDFQNARYYCKQAMELTKDTVDTLWDVECLCLMGMTYSMQKEYEKAAALFEIALTMSEEMGDLDKVWKILFQIGSDASASGQLQNARNCFGKAIDTVESIRGKISVADDKISFIDDKLSVYVRMVYVLLQLKEYEEAFNYVERAKSRSLLDLLGNKIKWGKGKDKEASQEERKLQKKIKELLEKIQNEQSQPRDKQRTVMTKWKKELEQTRGKYADFLLKIKRENPELTSLVSVNPLTLKEVQELIEPDTTLLEYYVTEGVYENIPILDIVIWVVDKTNCEVVIRELPNDNLSALTSSIFAFREKIVTLQPDYEKDAEELYDFFIRSVKPYIKTKRICIVPYSVLHYLPFHALVNVDNTKSKAENKSHFLIEEYDIFYAPSASVLKFVLEKRKEISGKVLAFGNPELEDENLNLPHAEEEVKSIKESYPDTSIYMNEEATEEKIKNLSSSYDIIHFASHGELSPQSPLFSCIKMAKEKDEDGRLEVHEIFNLDLENTSLVTLSACETGLGKLSKGDELIGLTRGFIYAGTPSIVASLWSVNDKSTSDLMNLFYKNLKTHSKVESLRMAQFEMINGEVGRGIVRGVGGITNSEDGQGKPQPSMTVNGSHPYFWAPFILLGDWK